jgi:DNA primase small subunit
MRLNAATITFLRQAYREYYFKRADFIEFPEDISAREFGYMPFGGGMVRHLSFRNRGEAVAEILKQSPSSIYCSNAKYESPSAPMEEKGWLGAELILDIDATDIPTPCKRGHDLWYCESCGTSGRLPRPQKCPKCAGPSGEFHGTCETCLAAAKDHALRAECFLREDFGVAPTAIRTYFSGNRGYHLHVYDERFYKLDQLGRGEIADYMLGASLPPNQTIASALRRRSSGARPVAEGWTKRITQYVDGRREEYTGTLQKLVSEAVSSQKASVDASVTTDVHRVFRLAGTLHGNTGMCKMRVEAMDHFDPERDPVVLSAKRVALNVLFYPRFRVNGTGFGPFRSQMAELPTYAAVSILTRGLGEVA